MHRRLAKKVTLNTGDCGNTRVMQCFVYQNAVLSHALGIIMQCFLMHYDT